MSVPDGMAGDRVECAIDGTVVSGYSKADLVAAGKLKSTDGIYGIRFAHNTEATVSGFSMTKNSIDGAEAENRGSRFTAWPRLPSPQPAT